MLEVTTDEEGVFEERRVSLVPTYYLYSHTKLIQSDDVVINIITSCHKIRCL